MELFLHEFQSKHFSWLWQKAEAVPSGLAHNTAMITSPSPASIVSGWVLLLFGLLPGSWTYAQQLTISGYVEDNSSGERIPEVELYFPEIQRGTTTNQYGFYSLATTAGQVRLVVRHVGYESQEFHLVLRQDTTLNVALVPRVISLDEVEVVADPDRAVDNIQMSEHDIPIAQVERLPVLLGEPDIQKILQLLPGVQSGQEGSSGLYVRGGRADQNLILLDGLPVYNPSHVFGFFSVFPAQALKSVKLLKGAFPARYGGRLSSVVDYTMKEGNLKKFGGQAAVGIVSVRGLVEGPLKKDRASFLLSGRRTFIDYLLRPFRSPEEWTSGYFYDLHFKANYIVSNRDRLYLSAYAGRDLLTYIQKPTTRRTAREEVKTDIGWGNRLAALRWNRIVNDRTFANVLVGMTTYRYALESTTFDVGDRNKRSVTSEDSWRSGIVDGTVKVDVEYNAGSRHYLRFGAEGIWHRIQPGRTHFRVVEDGEEQQVTFTQFPTGRLKSGTIAAYVEDELFLHRLIRANVGLRASGYLVDGGPYGSVEPRLNVSARLSKRMAAKASVSTMQQYIHLLTNGGASLPNDLWIPSTDRIRPQRGEQAVVGLVWSSLSGRYELSLEAYWRRMQRLLEYETDANAAASAVLNWAELVEEGDGHARGLEIFAQKKTGRWTGWLGYTLGKSTRRFENLNGGNTFPDGYDRRHDISVVGQYRVTNGIEVAGTWVYGSGYPVWLPVGRFLADDSDFEYHYPIVLVDFGPLNSARAPDYHRLDLGIHFRKTRSWAVQTISLGVYNAYGRSNTFYIYTKLGYGQDSPTTLSEPIPVEIRHLTLFRWIPSLSYQLQF